MAHEVVYIIIIPKEMGHKQLPTPLQTNNLMAEAVTNCKVQPKRTKAIPLVKGHRMPKAVQNLLETREAKLHRLLDQTSFDKIYFKL